MKKALKTIGIILLILAFIALLVYFLVLRYPKLKENPQKENGIVLQAVR